VNRRVVAAGAVVAVAAVALVLVGRWEGRRDDSAQRRGIEAVRRLVGPLDSPSLAGFRVLPQFDCLTYGRSGNPVALELCIDSEGRVVQAIDRRGVHRRFWSLTFQPSAATTRVDPAEVRRLIDRMRADS
jgi:hypothetical protein